MAGMTADQMGEAERKIKEAEVRYVYDTTEKQVRMVKAGEPGGTLSQARELKRLAEEEEGGKESPFMQDGEGNWMLNPRARVSGVELMAFQSLRQSQERGESFDPVAAMTRASEQMKILREGFGGGGGGNTLPAWMTDPVAFTNAIKNVMGSSGGDSALKEALDTMQQTVQQMKEEKWQTQFEAQQKQIQDITGVLNRTLDAISDMKKDRAGKNEMDVISEIASEGLGLLKTEMPGLRKDLKEAVGSVALPSSKSNEQREARKTKFKQAIDADRKIEEIGRRVFFPGS